MSYYVIKEIKIKRKDNKISAMVADSSFRNYDNKFIYHYCDDLFESLRGATIEDKEAFLIYDIITGIYHVHHGKKYKNLECTFDYFEEFCTAFRHAMEEHRTNDYHKILETFKSDLDAWLVEDCIVKSTEYINYYIKSIRKEKIALNLRPYAKKFNSNYIKHRTGLLQNGNYEIEQI